MAVVTRSEKPQQAYAWGFSLIVRTLPVGLPGQRSARWPHLTV